MSRTIHKMPKHKNVKKRPNNLGICNCQQCRYVRMGKKDPTITRIKMRLRKWWNNRKELKGAYTD